jgi:hypothetical protein
MVTLTRTGGHPVAVNPAQVSLVRDREESFEAVLAAFDA